MSKIHRHLCLPIEQQENHVMAQGPSQPKDAAFSKNKKGMKFLTAWYERFNWIEYSKKTESVLLLLSHI